jgi:hypothetical protein
MEVEDEDEAPARRDWHDDRDEDRREDEPRYPRSQRDERDDRDEYRDEAPRRKRRKESQGESGKYVAAVLFGVLCLLVGGGIIWVLFQLPDWLKVREPVIPDDQWRTLEVPNRFRVSLPGVAVQKPATPIGTITLNQYECSPSKTLFCGVGYLQGELPADRQNLPADRLLEDACNGASNNLVLMGGTETRRTPITHEGHPGRELIIDVPKGQGKLVCRIFLVNRGILMVVIGGRGIGPEGEIARKVFGSLQLPIKN